ncbi:MAG: peptidoglycan editing factor PgeF [Pseudomonadota bacterium]
MKKLILDDFLHSQISYGFYGRSGGVSTGLYDSLNCAPYSSDDPLLVAENRRRVKEDLKADNLFSLKQIHSSTCLFVNSEKSLIGCAGDAMVTKERGQALGVLTADCGPVLFFGEDAIGTPVIGAAHAGWGGALKGVLESIIKQMEMLGAVRKTIHAAIGPCIGPASYEVNINFKEPFIDEDKEADVFFHSGKEEKLLFDLPSYISFRLKRAGVLHIVTAGHDTYAMNSEYFSFRRATHRGEKDYGRQISAITIGMG